MTFRQFLGLYGDRFMGPSYRGMRSVADVLIDRVAPEDPAILAEISGGRTEYPSSLWRFLLLWARRTGKTLFVGLVVVYISIFRKVETTQLGEQLRVHVIAPSRAQCRIIMGYVKGLLNEIPAFAALIVAETAESITLSNGRVIEVGTANPRTLRGYQHLAVVIDEAMYLTDEATASNPLTEILTAIEPSLAALSGQLFMISSVHARTGTVYETFKSTFGQNDPETCTLLAKTRTMNPTVPQSVIDRAIERDASAARAEWLSEWREDVETFLSRTAIDAVVIPDRLELPRVPGVSYVAFLDFAGGGGADSAALAIGHTEKRDGIEIGVLDAIREIKPPFSPSGACAEFAGAMRSYGITTAVSDRWGGEFPIEGMRKHSIVVTPSARPKSELYLELAPRINSRSVELLDQARLIAQLAALERRTGRGGRDSVDHPPHGRDDVSNAVSGVLTMRGGGSLIRIRSLDNDLKTGDDVRSAFARSKAAHDFSRRFTPFD